MDLFTIGSIVGSLTGGKVVKSKSKKKKSESHQLGSPVAALLIAIGTAGLRSLLGDAPFDPLEVVQQGGGLGAAAIAIHSVAKPLINLIKGIF